MDIDTNKHMRWIGNTVRFSEKCESCSFSPVCFGACCPKENIFEKTVNSQDFSVICPSEKEQILYTLKMIDKTTPFSFIEENMED